MVDRSDEAGDPACWAHLFEDDRIAPDQAEDHRESGHGAGDQGAALASEPCAEAPGS